MTSSSEKFPGKPLLQRQGVWVNIVAVIWGTVVSTCYLFQYFDLYSSLIEKIKKLW